jgi:hypothetical protein
MKNRIVKLFNIKYQSPKSVQSDLETYFYTSLDTLDYENGDDADLIIQSIAGDKISDKTGWLVESFDYKLYEFGNVLITFWNEGNDKTMEKVIYTDWPVDEIEDNILALLEANDYIKHLKACGGKFDYVETSYILEF